MKQATYTGLDGNPFIVTYDPNTPCIACGEPVREASMGGTNICPWCDCGRCRYCGRQITFRELMSKDKWKDHVSACKKKAPC